MFHDGAEATEPRAGVWVEAWTKSHVLALVVLAGEKAPVSVCYVEKQDLICIANVAANTVIGVWLTICGCHVCSLKLK